MGKEETVEMEVLVVGGGYGGYMAALSVCVHGVKVTVVEKAHV